MVAAGGGITGTVPDGDVEVHARGGWKENPGPGEALVQPGMYESQDDTWHTFVPGKVTGPTRYTYQRGKLPGPEPQEEPYFP